MPATEDDYDPEWIDLTKAMGAQLELPTEIRSRREFFDQMLVEIGKQLPPTKAGIETRDEQITPEIKVRIYSPPHTHGRKLPCLVFCHGGGWFHGNLDTEDHECRLVCGEVDCVVVSVDYRLAPDIKFPVPIDDCYTAYKWAHSQADALGADPKRYVIWGGSAGGGLAIAVAYKLVSSGQRSKIVGLVAMGAMCLFPDACPEQYMHLHKAYIENGGDVPIVTANDCVIAYKLLSAVPPYTGETSTWFPTAIGWEAFKDFPPTYIINTDKEVMRDDGAVLEAELNDAGAKVKRDVFMGLPHYFWVFPVKEAGERFRRKLVNGILWILESAR